MDTSDVVVRATREIVSGLKLGDIKEISEALSRGTLERLVLLSDVLESHGVKVPKSKEEVEEMLRKPRSCAQT